MLANGAEPSWRAALQSNALACRSMSTTSARPPSRCATAARLTASVVFPLPPFCWSTATVNNGVLLSAATGVRKVLSTVVIVHVPFPSTAGPPR